MKKDFPKSVTLSSSLNSKFSFVKLITKTDLFICLIIFILGFLTRAPLIERMQSHWDGPQYSIALVRGFNFSQDTPAPPGYPIYLAMGYVFYLLFRDPHLGLLCVSILFSAVSATIIFLTGRYMFNRIGGVIASLIFLSGSTFYFFGLTPYGYILITTFTPLLALIVYGIVFKKTLSGLILGSFYALSLSYRPQEAIYTFPLFLLGFFSLSTGKEKTKALSSFLIFFLLWFVPYLQIATKGSIFNFLDLLRSSGGTGIPYPSFSHVVSQKTLTIILAGLYLSFGLSCLLLFYYIYLFFEKYSSFGIKYFLKNKIILFYSVWILPCFLFNIFIRSDHAGYQLTYLCALLFLIANALWKIFHKKKLILIFLVGVIIFFNLFVFFENRDPQYSKPFRQTSFHYSDIRRNDKELGDKIAFIQKHFNPENTIIVMSPVFWRQTMYYLPKYQTYALGALVSQEAIISDSFIESKNWERTTKNTKKRFILIPPKIKTLVLFDNESINWYSGIHKTYSFGGIIGINIIPVDVKRIFEYGYHKVYLKNQ